MGQVKDKTNKRISLCIRICISIRISSRISKVEVETKCSTGVRLRIRRGSRDTPYVQGRPSCVVEVESNRNGGDIWGYLLLPQTPSKSQIFISKCQIFFTKTLKSCNFLSNFVIIYLNK